MSQDHHKRAMLSIFPLFTLDIPLLFFYSVTEWLRNYLVTEEGA
jgi:hypothetical protein